MYNIAIYTRISSKNKLQKQSESITNQKNIIKSFIKNNNDLKNSNIFYYTDIGYSGANFERPDIKRLIEDVKKQKIDCIIVKDLSRFGRNYIQVHNYLDNIFPFMNIRFISINDNYDSIKNKNYTLNMDISFKNIIYSYYIKDLSKKIKTGKISKAKQGNYISSFAPFGYKKNKETNRLEIDEETANIVVSIFDLVYNGKSYSQVCKILNENNIPTKSDFKIKNSEIKNYKNRNENKIWKINDIYTIISNQVYIGDTVTFKKRCKNFGDRNTIKSNDKEKIIIENTHKPIIKKEIFEKLNSKKRKPQDNNPKNIFAYKLKCGYCKYGLRYTNIGKNYKYRNFYCNTKNEKYNTNCYNVNILEKDLKNIIFQIINKNLLLIEDINIKNNKNSLKYEILSLKECIKILNYEKSQVYEEYLEERLSKVKYLERKKDIKNKIIQYEEKIKKIENNLLKLENSSVEFNKYLKESQVTKRVIDCFIDKIYIYSESNIKIKWKFKDFSLQ